MQDLQDVGEVEGSLGSYGVSARVGPLKAGLAYKSADYDAIGNRGGDWGRHEGADFTILVIGGEYFLEKPKTWPPEDKRKKLEELQKLQQSEESEESEESQNSTPESQESAQESANLNPVVDETSVETQEFLKQQNQSPEQSMAEKIKENSAYLRRKNYRARFPFGTTDSAEKKRNLLKDKGGWAPPHVFTDIRFSAGLFAGFSMGLNPGELLDFLLGFTNIDIYSDDVDLENLPQELKDKLPQ